MMLERDLEIVGDRQAGEDARHLELDAQAPPDPLEGLERRHVRAAVEHLAAIRTVLADEQTEERALAGPIRADQAVDLALAEGEIDGVGDVEAAETLVEAACFGSAVIGRAPFCRGGRARA